MRHTYSLFLGLSLVFVFLIGCDDDIESRFQRGIGTVAPSAEPAPYSLGAVGFVEGHVIDILDQAPLSGLDVTMFDLNSHSTLPTIKTNADGFFRFERVPVGDYVPIVFINGMEVFHLAKPRWALGVGETIELNLEMAPARSIPGTRYFMNGLVWDRENSKPVAGARIEMNGYYSGHINFSEYAGRANLLEPVSDENGRFRLGPLPWIPFPDPADPDANIRIVPSYRITAPGYKSRFYKEVTHPADIAEVTVKLTPGEDDGVIEGTVYGYDGVPLAGVPVVTEWRTARGVKLRDGQQALVPINNGSLVIATDGAVFTDERGRYRIENQPDGWFTMRAGPFGDDGWVGPLLSGIWVYSVDGPTEAPPLFATRPVVLTSPDDGITVGQPPELRWEPLENAASYQVHVQRGGDENIKIFELTRPYLQMTYATELFDRSGVFRWSVAALDEFGVAFSIPDRSGSFIFHLAESGNTDL